MNSRAVLSGVAVLIAGSVATLALPPAIGRAWLAATVFAIGLPAGSIGFLLMMRLVGGRWREALAPALARGAATLPLAAAAVVPVLLGVMRLYPWTVVPVSGFQGAWLQPWAFALRSLLWLGGIWAAFLGLSRWPQAAAAIGLLFFVPMGSLVAVDWVMSLTPDFHASGFGLQMIDLWFGIALAVAILRDPRDDTGTVGALLLTLMMLWAYFAYLGFFIIWSGNVPAGAAWYLARANGGWGWVAGAAALLHVMPLLALLSGRVRRSPTGLRLTGGAALAGDLVFAGWLVLPTDGPVAIASALTYLVAIAILAAAVWLGERAR